MEPSPLPFCPDTLSAEPHPRHFYCHSLKWSLRFDETRSWWCVVGYCAAGHLSMPGPQVPEASAPFLSYILHPPAGLFWFEYHKFLILLINLSHWHFIFRYLYQEIICMISQLSHTWETFFLLPVYIKDSVESEPSGLQTHFHWILGSSVTEKSEASDLALVAYGLSLHSVLIPSGRL